MLTGAPNIDRFFFCYFVATIQVMPPMTKAMAWFFFPLLLLEGDNLAWMAGTI
jgi:hypothetical protein